MPVPTLDSVVEGLPKRDRMLIKMDGEGFEPRRVSADDVSRWVHQGHVDFGTHNYLFC